MKKAFFFLTCFLTACSGNSVFELQLVFPSEEIKNRITQLEVWALYSEEHFSCLGLQAGQNQPGSFEQLAHLAFDFPPARPPVLKGVRNGPALFFAEGRAADSILLRGCTKKEAGQEGGTIVLELLCVCNPAAGCTAEQEISDDLLDNDCDGLTDEECTRDEDCQDGFDCTEDSCLTGQGRCQHLPKDSLCFQDGIYCNGPEICRPGAGCISSGNPCRLSGLVCNEEQKTCSSCLSSSECSDDIDCTRDLCQPTGFCFYEPDDAACADDGVFCNGAEYCDPFIGCAHRGNPCSTREVCDEFSRSCLPCPDCRPFSLWWTATGGGLINLEGYRLQVYVGPAAAAGSTTAGGYQIKLGPAAIGRK